MSHLALTLMDQIHVNVHKINPNEKYLSVFSEEAQNFLPQYLGKLLG